MYHYLCIWVIEKPYTVSKVIGKPQMKLIYCNAACTSLSFSSISCKIKQDFFHPFFSHPLLLVVRSATVKLAVGTWMAGHSQRSGCSGAAQTPNCQFFSKAPIEVRNYKERATSSAMPYCATDKCDYRAIIVGCCCVRKQILYIYKFILLLVSIY